MGNSITASGATVVGQVYRIISQSTLDFTAVGAPDNSANTIFTADGVDTLGAGDELFHFTGAGGTNTATTMRV